MKTLRSVSTGAVLLALALSACVLAAPAGAIARPHHGAHRANGKGHKTHTVSFRARVVSSSKRGLVVRATDGRTVKIAATAISRPKVPPKHRHKHLKHGVRAAADAQLQAGSVTVSILGLQPGVLVLITETTDNTGSLTMTITLPPPSANANQQAAGVVTEVDSDAFMLRTSDGSALLLHMARSALSQLSLQTCAMVDVTYHQDASLLIAETVTSTGTSTLGDCTPTDDVAGTITHVSENGLTINTDRGTLTYRADSSLSLADRFQVGDLVSVNYTQDAAGALTAHDVEFVEEEASGVVTSVTTSANGGIVTITDGASGQPETFIANPGDGVQVFAKAFNGVSVGDQIKVTYHQSAGRLFADSVDDRSDS